MKRALMAIMLCGLTGCIEDPSDVEIGEPSTDPPNSSAMTTENTPQACAEGDRVDQDGDGLVDCNDPDCRGIACDPAEPTKTCLPNGKCDD